MNDLFLVRHGATEWSQAGRHTSHTDLPLLVEGELQAQAVAPRLTHLEIVAAWRSPRLRAQTTAALAGFPEAEPTEDLAEWGYGDYEGITTAQIRQSDPTWTIWEGVTPGGESAAHITERLDRVIARARAVEGNVVLFGHGHSLRALAARWLGLPVEAGRLFKLETATLSRLGYERDQPVIAAWNS